MDKESNISKAKEMLIHTDYLKKEIERNEDEALTINQVREMNGMLTL